MSEFKTPLSRTEAILQNILGDDNKLGIPLSRIEKLLMAILNKTDYTDGILSQAEEILYAILKDGEWNKTPKSRSEKILKSILDGEEYTGEIDEESRIEVLLREWSKGTGPKYVIRTVTGAIVKILDALAEPAVSLKVFLEPKQDLHGYEYPWPPGGGKNLFYIDTDKTNTLNGVTGTFDAETQTISVVGTNMSSSEYILLNLECTGDIPREVALARTLFNAPSGVYINLVYKKNNTWHGVSNGGSIPTEIDSRVNLQIGVYGTATTVNATNIKVQIELGSTGTTYAPYSNICPISGWDEVSVFVGETQSEEDATKYSVSFESQGTVYGGTLDIVSGVLTVTNKHFTYNSIAYYGTYGSENAPLYYCDIPNYKNEPIKKHPSVLSEGLLLSNIFAPISTEYLANMKNYEIRVSDSALPSRFYMRVDGQNPVSASHPLEVVAELQTPLTYQLTPQEVQMLLGSNTIWSDGDDMELMYKAPNVSLQVMNTRKKLMTIKKGLKL